MANWKLFEIGRRWLLATADPYQRISSSINATSMSESTSTVSVAGGVCDFPGLVESSPASCTEAHGGVDIVPGSGGEHGGVWVSPAKAVTPRTDVKTTTPSILLIRLMVFSVC